MFSEVRGFTFLTEGKRMAFRNVTSCIMVPFTSFTMKRKPESITETSVLTYQIK
jgi:hypothetical protein